jgi:hypothetical protein
MKYPVWLVGWLVCRCPENLTGKDLCGSFLAQPQVFILISLNNKNVKNAYS